MCEVKQIGNIMPGTNRDNPNQGRVYDTSGIAPTINTMQGGNLQPMVVVKEVGYLENGTGKHQSNTVYDPSGLSPTVTTILNGGTQQIKIIENDKRNDMSKQ